MTLDYRRGTLSADEELVAVAVGLAAGLAALYLTRRWLAREPLFGPPPSPEVPGTGGRVPATGRADDADRSGGTAEPGR